MTGRYQHERRTQTERLRRALVESPNGIDPLAWLNEPAPDGGYRISRCASRINDLRRAGHQIETIRNGRATLYRLVRAHDTNGVDPQPAERAISEPAALLLDVPVEHPAPASAITGMDS